MWNYIWPALVALISGVLYHVSQKSTPSDVNAFGALFITYIIAAAVSFVIFAATAGPANIVTELKKVNWSAYLLTIAILGTEVGYLFMYRAGWDVSVASLLCNVCIAILLVFVGILLYKEGISVRQIVGIAVCIAGLFLVAGGNIGKA